MHVYVLYSPSLRKHYVGMSCDPWTRLKPHRRGQGWWTSRAEDWVLVHQESADDRETARALEKTIKQRGAGRCLADKSR